MSARSDRYALARLRATLGSTPALAPSWAWLCAEAGEELDWQLAAGELAGATAALLAAGDLADEALESIFSALEALIEEAGGALLALGFLRALEPEARRRADSYLHPRSAALCAALARQIDSERHRDDGRDVWHRGAGR